MRRTNLSVRIFGAVLIGLGMPAIGRAQTPQDPEAAQKEINAWYAEQVKQAQANKTTVDFAKLLAERKAKILAALKDADPAKTEATKCLALGQLYQSVQQYKESLVCAQRFMTTNPEGVQKYAAQQMMLSAYQNLGDADGILSTLDQMKPATPQMWALLTSSTARSYAGVVAKAKGLNAGIALIDKMEARTPFDQLKTDQEKKIGESTVAVLAMGRSSLYEDAGKVSEALAALEAGVKKLGADNAYARQMVSKIKLAKIPGSPAPELVAERHYGEFKDLASLRGKVVVLDFTAHW